MARNARAATIIAGIGITALTACAGADLDLRDRMAGAFDSSGATGGSVARPEPDARGVITYATYQVAVAQRGDTARSVAQRIGFGADELARFNGVDPDAALNAEAILVLPRPTGPEGRPDIASVAGAAIDRSGASTAPTPSAAGPEPVRHRVSRGETAFSIARLYGVSVRSLADWNGLGPDLSVRDGQFLLIPLVVASAEQSATVTTPGAGTATPEPPSAASALPEATVEAVVLPPSPNFDQFRTEASDTPDDAPEAEPSAEAAAPQSSAEAANPAPRPVPSEASAGNTSRLITPVAGPMRRGFSEANEGIDFAAPAGAPVSAAAAGTVAAITRDTDQVPILVLRHGDGLLTVYANITDISVEKGDTVTAGQTIARVGEGDPSFLHFELRRGLDPVDPTPFLR